MQACHGGEGTEEGGGRQSYNSRYGANRRQLYAINHLKVGSGDSPEAQKTQSSVRQKAGDMEGVHQKEP